MKVQLSILCTLTFAACANNLDVTPVQKVLQLMTGMAEKGKKEKHDEEVNYAAAKEFCDNAKERKAAAVEDEGQKIAALTTAIEVATTKAAGLSKDIGLLQKDSDTWKGDIKAATKVRAIEKADYDQKHHAHSEAIESIAGALVILKKQAADKKQSPASFAQVSALQDLPIMPAAAKRALGLFLQQGGQDRDGPDLLDMLASQQSKNKNLLQQGDGIEQSAAPEANAYEFHGDIVVDMLQKLQDKFIEERTNAEKQETSNRNVFALLVQDLNAQVESAAEDSTEKTLAKTKTMQLKARKTSDKIEQVTLKADDTKFLQDLTTDCSVKKSDFIARQQLRTDEIEAIEKASEIISSSAAKGSGKSLLQKHGKSFGQLRSNENTQQLQSLAAAYLHDQAAKINSRVLEAAAVHAGADPMNKVKKMIRDMIVRLNEEANSESTHKGFCDKELATNKHTRLQKTSSVQTLSAEIDQLSSTIAKAGEDISELSGAIVDLDKGIAAQTDIRTKDKAENAESEKDASEAQVAVAQALVVLKEFYDKAADATSFLQVPYNGMAGESGGVVAMLEVIQGDFARVESETKIAEASAQRTYDAFVSTSKEDKAAKQASLTHTTSKKEDAQANLLATRNDLEGTQVELTAALATFEKLKPSCVDSGVSFEDRVNRRKEEIESLKEALKIMAGDSIA